MFMKGIFLTSVLKRNSRDRVSCGIEFLFTGVRDSGCQVNIATLAHSVIWLNINLCELF